MNRKTKRFCRYFCTVVLLIFVTFFINRGNTFAVEYKDKMTLVGLGDCIMAFKVSVIKDPRFLKLVDIIRQADCAWANCENPLVEPDNVYPELRDDFVIACEPWAADEFKWLGIDMVSIANNHTLDYGAAGLYSTIENLNRVGISYAGAGRDLEEAAKPRYIDTEGGRIAQVACAASYPAGSNASMPHPLQIGRPGINPLHFTRVVSLEKETFEAFYKIYPTIADIQGISIPDKAKREIELGSTIYVEGEKTELDGRIDETDTRRVIDSIKIARRNARLVVLSVHLHKGKKKHNESANFAEKFAHDCIDAGADVFFCTGAHIPRGIEIYKNKPIFYSIGNFFFHCGSFGVYPPESYVRYKFPPDTRDTTLMDEASFVEEFKNPFILKSIVPVITYEKGNVVTDIKLYPIDLGQGEPVYRIGSPVMADEKDARMVIDEFASLSKKYGTVILYRNGIGEVKVNVTPTNYSN